MPELAKVVLVEEEATVVVTDADELAIKLAPASVSIAHAVPAVVDHVLAGVPGRPGRSITVHFDTSPPTGADVGSEGDLWVVTG